MGLLDSPPTDGLWGTFLLAGGSEMRQWCVGGHAPSRIGAWVWPGRSSGSLSGSLRLSYHCSMSSDLLWKMLLVLWPLAFSTGHWIHPPPLSSSHPSCRSQCQRGTRIALNYLFTFQMAYWLGGDHRTPGTRFSMAGFPSCLAKSIWQAIFNAHWNRLEGGQH